MKAAIISIVVSLGAVVPLVSPAAASGEPGELLSDQASTSGAGVPGDLTGDGRVNFADVTFVLAHWGAFGMSDLTFVLANWTG